MNESAVDLDCGCLTKETVIDVLVDLLDKEGCLSDKEKFKKDVWAREKLSPTGVSEGVAVPHARSQAVKKTGISIVSLKQPIDFGAHDNKPTRLFFMIATPADSHELHVEILGRLSLVLLEKDFREKIMHLGDKGRFLRLLDRVEAKKFTNLE